MQVDVISNAPTTRCYICHKPEVDKICHHCGRAICNAHLSSSIPLESGFENPEFSNLDLDHLTSEKEIVHCEDCIHFVRSYKWMRPLAIKFGGFSLVIAVIAILTKLWWLILIGIFSLAGSIIWFRWINRKHEESYEQARLKNPPSFPTVPSLKSISVTEQITGQISLDNNGKYSTNINQTKGKLSVSLQFSYREKERIEAYLKKYKLLVSKEIPFHAGFLVLEGAPNLEFDESRSFLEKRPNTISLLGTIGDQPFLIDEEARHDSNWTSRFTYTVIDGKERKAPLPVQIIPTLVQEGAQRAIDLVVQVLPEITDSKDLGTIRIEELILYAPQRLSKIAMVQPSAVTGTHLNNHNKSEPMQSITWKDVGIQSNARRECRQRFYIRFENKIEPTTIFQGKLRVFFSGTLSELDGINFFYPWGQKRSDEVAIRRQTFLDVNFQLDLAGLRFQEIASESTQLLREGVLPTHAIVTKLTDDLNNAGVYVKRVIENPARTSKAGAHITNRYWDMAGRYYEGVYPIDFHLVMTGEEVYARAKESKVQVDITVQGVVTNDEMRGKVAHLLAQLSAITENTLDTLPAAQENAIATEVHSDLEPELQTQLNSLYSTKSEDLKTSKQISHLVEMLQKLDEALIEGRISENRYDEMKTQYNNHLSELGYTI